jgi:hypothetical protein
VRRRWRISSILIILFGKEAGSRIDFYGVEKEAKESLRFALSSSNPAKSSEVHDDGALARTIRAMDNLTPVEFLSKLQKGNKPASSDLALLEELTVEMGLSAPLCNALVFYVITTKDGQLPAKYAEKIAASLMRKGIETSLDAMNYFSAGKKTYSKPAESEVGPSVPLLKPKPSSALTDKETTISDAEFDQLMSELYTPKKGGQIDDGRNQKFDQILCPEKTSNKALEDDVERCRVSQRTPYARLSDQAIEENLPLVSSLSRRPPLLRPLPGPREVRQRPESPGAMKLVWANGLLQREYSPCDLYMAKEQLLRGYLYRDFPEEWLSSRPNSLGRTDPGQRGAWRHGPRWRKIRDNLGLISPGRTRLGPLLIFWPPTPI